MRFDVHRSQLGCALGRVAPPLRMGDTWPWPPVACRVDAVVAGMSGTVSSQSAIATFGGGGGAFECGVDPSAGRRRGPYVLPEHEGASRSGHGRWSFATNVARRGRGAELDHDRVTLVSRVRRSGPDDRFALARVDPQRPLGSAATSAGARPRNESPT